MLIAIIKASSLSVTMTLGRPSDVMNNPFILSRPQTKLFTHSFDKNTKAIEKFNPVDVKPSTKI